MNRYSRHIALKEIGHEGQNKLLKAKVLVIGAGGLGCPVLQYLTAAGIGTIGIIDFDQVEESNLQRQVLFGRSDIGKNKALAAKARLSHLNHTITLRAYPFALTYQNALELFDQYDIIVDGSDNYATRYLVNDACILSGKPLVYGAIFKFEGQVSVLNYQDGPSYRCLFPEAPKEEVLMNCAEVGVLGVLPGIIGSMQANEVIKIILDLGSILSGKLSIYDALQQQMSSVSFKRSQKQIAQVRSKRTTFRERELSWPCSTNTPEIGAEELSHLKGIQFVDLRELEETPRLQLEGLIQLPMSQLHTFEDCLDPEKNNILFCASGVRSLKAAFWLREKGVSNCFSLREGVRALLNHQKITHNERA